MDQYFASLPTDQIGGELVKRTDSYYKYIYANGILQRWRKAYLQYYGTNNDKKSSRVKSAGSEGELSVLSSNEYRNLIQHLLVLTCQQRPDMQCRAANTDYDSQVQCLLGNGLLEYYLREARLERFLRQAVEISLVLDFAWVLSTWDTQLGDPVAADQSQNPPVILRQGDIKYAALTPLDLIYDFTRRSAEGLDWGITREYVNKYDLAAQFPDQADEIIKRGRDLAKEETYRFDNFFLQEGLDSAEIAQYTFYHRKTPSMPDGRMLQFLDSKIVLFDAPIPYRKLPFSRVAPGEMIGKAFGYTSANDLLALQDVIDAIFSAVTTNITTFGVSNIWAPPGHNLEVTQIAQGMNLFESKVEPKVVNFASFPGQVMEVLNFAIQRQEVLSGMNSVARGIPPSGDMSGAAMALLQSMAMQFNSGLQQSYVQLVEDVGGLTINHLQDFANAPRIAQIAGKHNQFEAEEFSSQDIKDIQRVFVDMGNPLSKTVSGRMTMAQEMLKNGLIKDPQQYIMVMTTGRLEPVLEDEQALLLSIKQENEALQNGQQVPVINIEHHELHIPSHYSIIASPDAKKNPQIVQNVLAHIQEHLNEWYQADPRLLMLLKIPPPPPPPMPPGMMPPPGAPGPNGHPMLSPGHSAPPHAGPPPGPSGQPPKAQLTDSAQQAGVHAPSMPQNPLTKQPWSPQTGGLPPQ